MGTLTDFSSGCGPLWALSALDWQEQPHGEGGNARNEGRGDGSDLFYGRYGHVAAGAHEVVELVPQEQQAFHMGKTTDAP